MPIYEYSCVECESRVEKMQKISEAPLAVCEKCGGRLEKQWSLSGFQFKGAGWYVTDYANKGKSDAKTETSKTGTAAVTKSEASDSSEKKSAVESTAKTESASNSAKSDASASKKE